MREIKFRGKRIDNDEWVYGYVAIHTIIGEETELKTVIVQKPDKIYQYDSWIVDSETVGQYTGLQDKNGVEIFEGDVHGFEDCTFEIRHGTYTDEMIGEESYGWHTYDSRVGTGCNLGESETWVNIIGNIHEREVQK